METRGQLKMVAVACALIAGLSAAAPARIIYVDDDAAGAADGMSWRSAFPHLQDALAVAQPGDEIRVAQGLYRPDQNVRVPMAHGRRVEISPSGLRTASFQLHNAVTLRGGFAGVLAADPDARNVGQYETILSGDLKGNDIADWGVDHPGSEFLRDDNSQYVVESRNTNATAVLDGFSIQSAAESGLHNARGSPQVVNCTFRWNCALRLSGGALLCEGGQPTLSHCVFRENSATVTGGAIYASATRLMLSDCRFVSSQATSLIH